VSEANGKLPSPDRQRFLRIALGSALECAATLDVLRVCAATDGSTAEAGKQLLQRIVAMLTRMTRRPTMELREESEYEYRCAEYEDDKEDRRQSGGGADG
jgi:hypothetical protein